MRKLIGKILRKLGLYKYYRNILRFVNFRLIFPGVYKKYAKRPLNNKKVIFIELRYDQITDNFKLLYNRIKKTGKYDVKIIFLKNIDPNKRAYMKRCFKMLKEIADAKYVFLNDGCNVTSCIPLRKGTIITQTWHACGAFKKFGMSTADKIFGSTADVLLKYPNYGNLSYVTVSSPEVVWAYEEAMILKHEDNIVRPVGTSRTDIFFSSQFRKEALDKLDEVFPKRGGRKVILYAPTFRGRVATAQTPNCLDIGAMKESLEDKYILLIKHHPLVKNRPIIDSEYSNFAMDVTDVMSIEMLLCESDLCITDYSSLIFEYSLFERPMIFFAYDIEEYFDWRGFYYKYDELAPGPVVDNTESIIESIKNIEKHFDKTRVHEFKEKFMSACDGHATDRILEMIGIDA